MVVGSGGCNDNGIDASYLAELLNDTATDDFDMASRATPNDPDEVMLFGGHLNVSGEHQSVHSVTATTDLPIAPVRGCKLVYRLPHPTLGMRLSWKCAS